MLFADVEGSTGLQEVAGREYARAIGDLRRLLREQIVARGGLQVDAIGDEVFAVFDDALSGVLRRSPPSRRCGTTRGRSSATSVFASASTPARRTWARRATRGSTWCAPPGSPMRATADRSSSRPQRRRSSGTSRRMHSARTALRASRRRSSCTRCGPTGCRATSRRSATRSRRSATPMRVVIADDSVLLREGVVRLLEEAGFEVVGQSGTADDLLRHVAMHKPHVAIVDVRMPPTHTDEGLRAAQRDPPSLPTHRGARAFAVRRAAVRPGASLKRGRGLRLPAQGSRLRPRGVRGLGESE